jgi:outer membrane protein OmpA-like peptidoglycan-associated protein
MQAFQGSILVAVDWVWESLSVLLNTGFLFREQLNPFERVPIGSEFMIRPGVAYRFGLGAYSMGVGAEANIATGLDSFFGNENTNAFQLLFSVQLMPNQSSDGVYAALGGGSRLQGGGYGVPLANVDSRVGYSIQWGAPRDEFVEEERPATVPDEVPEEVPEDKKPVVAKVEPVPLVKLPPQEAPITASVTRVSGAGIVQIGFAPDAPSKSQMASGSAALPPSARKQLAAKREEISAGLRRPGARLVVIGFADKCFQGPPYLANIYNKDLSKRRARALVDLLREVMGGALRGVPVETLAMGRRCANPACRCATSEMRECADDRRVEIHIEYGGPAEYQCPHGEYWLAR